MAKPPERPPPPEKLTRWQKDTTERLEKLQHDVDALQLAQAEAAEELRHLHRMAHRTLKVVEDIQRMLVELESRGNLSHITARFEPLRRARPQTA